MKLVVTRCLLQSVPPAFIPIAGQPYRLAVQRFGKTTFNALMTSCTQEFSLIGSRAMISLPAITRMAITAVVVGSTKDSASFPTLLSP